MSVTFSNPIHAYMATHHGAWLRAGGQNCTQAHPRSYTVLKHKTGKTLGHIKKVLHEHVRGVRCKRANEKE